MVEVHSIALLVAVVGYYLALGGILFRITASSESKNIVERELIQPAKRRRELARREVMYELMDEQIYHKNLRMCPEAFKKLCELLRGTGLIRDNQYSYVEEQVSKCLHILAHGTRSSLSSLLYRRSSETVSRHFHQVLRAIISLEDRFLIQPDGKNVQYKIKYSGGRFNPYFENCVGAIDGTHIRVKVRNKDVSRYRGRKFFPTMNVLAACTFDLHFTYVLPDWEGSASDSRILDDSLRREDKLIVPQGKYYLVDAGYMLRSGFITPYRNTRYHLKEYSHHYLPSTPQELFNLRHSSLRIAVERAFGAQKSFNQIRDKELHNLDLLREIYEKDRATDNEAESAKEKLQRWQKETTQVSIDELDQMQARQEIHLESFDPFVEVSPPTNSKEECSSSGPKPKSRTLKRKAALMDLLVAEMSEMKDVIKEMAQAVKVAYPPSRSQEKIAEELKKMGFIGHRLIEAIEYLMADPRRKDTFFEIPENMRAAWLLEKMHG